VDRFAVDTINVLAVMVDPIVLDADNVEPCTDDTVSVLVRILEKRVLCAFNDEIVMIFALNVRVSMVEYNTVDPLIVERVALLPDSVDRVRTETDRVLPIKDEKVVMVLSNRVDAVIVDTDILEPAIVE